MRCDACAWWKRFPSPPGNPNPLGTCRLFETRRGDKVWPTAKLMVTRTGTGEATVVTDEGFGCAQFVRRSPTGRVTS